MGEVIYLANAIRGQKPLVDYPALTRSEIDRLEGIRDNVEALLTMVSEIRRDPEAVTYASARYGLMRMYYLHGRAATMAFAERCTETAEIGEDLSNV
ncbi:MAG: hypothetical protein GWP36_05510 [Bacteroidetes bacterium]|nr:hypothetical protein [Bacteroidota bacterium]